MPLEIFEDTTWQMSWGERAAVEGVLAQCRPSLAIEIGSMEGASLRRIAAYTGEVHSFDLAPPTLEIPDNVVLHTGDSHELLPAFLAEIAEQRRNVDFVMVDGDHTSEGVRRDMEDLLDSPALGQSVILIHDTANEQVRRGLDAVRFTAWPKVTHVDLDWVPGHLFATPRLRNELWCGLGLVRVDATRPAYLAGSVYQQEHHPAAVLLAQARNLVVASERLAESAGADEDDPISLRARVAELALSLDDLRTREAEMRAREAELGAEISLLRMRVERADMTLEDVKSSVSWRITQPLRSAKRQVGRRSNG